MTYLNLAWFCINFFSLLFAVMWPFQFISISRDFCRSVQWNEERCNDTYNMAKEIVTKNKCKKDRPDGERMNEKDKEEKRELQQTQSKNCNS